MHIIFALCPGQYFITQFGLDLSSQQKYYFALLVTVYMYILVCTMPSDAELMVV